MTKPISQDRIKELVSQYKGGASSSLTKEIKPLPTPSDVEAYSVNKDDEKSDQIISVQRMKFDPKDYIPKVNPVYKTRAIDDIMEKLANTFDPQGKRISVLLQGEAGSGKTELAIHYSAKHKLPFLRVACDDTSTLKEYMGKREIVEGNTIYKTGILLELCQVPSVVLIDEFNALPPSRLFFLHELLDNRRFFIKDADGGIVINLHEDCRVILACNPNSAKYTGTNKMNSALLDRTSHIKMFPFKPEDVPHLFDTGNPAVTKGLMQFYTDTNRVINEQNWRAVFSLRSIQRIVAMLKQGMTIEDSLSYGFLNMLETTAGKDEKKAVVNSARFIFGKEVFNPATYIED